MNYADKAHRLSFIIYLALSATVLILIAAAELLENLGFRGTLTDFEAKADFLRYALYILGIMIIFSIRLVKTSLLRKTFSSEVEALKKLSVCAVIIGAINEATAFVGFLLFIFSGNKLDFYILAALSLFSTVINLPKKEKWDEYLRTAGMYGDSPEIKP